MPLQDKYINPFTDFGFKRLFGSEPNKDLLIDFLNQLLPEKHQIQDLQYKSGEKMGKSRLDRKAIYDLYCESENGDKFIVELQKAKQNYFKDRSIFYSTFPIQDQAKRGDWDFKLSAVYTIGILDFVFEEDKSEQKVLHIVQLKDQECQVFYDKLTFIYLEMPNFEKKESELQTHFDKWLYVFKNLHRLENAPTKFQEKIFSKLFEQAEIANLNKKQMLDYEQSLKYYRDLKNVTDTAFMDGEQIGIEKGKIEGRIEGEQIGLEKGKEIGLKDAITNLIKNTTFTDEQIATFVGVNIDFVQKIRAEMTQ